MFTYKLNILALGTILLGQNIGHAQVVTDGTTGDAVAVTGPDFDIGADLGTQAGANLFHSFEQFSIGTGESATFSGPDSIDNVIGRVTGGDLSTVDGLLASTIPGASLWLFNPAGVVFGPNASLDVSGSFHVSTADELRTADGSTFSAIDPEASGFSVARPESFGFLGADPAGVAINGSQLGVEDGDLSIVAGDIEIDEAASLAVAGAELNLLAVDGPADANVTTGELTGAVGGDISVGGGAILASIGDGGGTVRIEGGAFVVDEASQIVSGNTGATDGDVGISINTESAEITGGSVIAAASLAEGRGGDLDVETTSLVITGGSNIGTNAQADGKAGDTNLRARNVRVADGSSVISRSSASGDGGDINISGETVAFEANGSASSFAEADGSGGGISVVANDLVLSDAIIASDTSSAGEGGDIEISGKRVTIQDGSFTITVAGGSGSGGSIIVATNDLTLIDGAIFTSALEGSTGNGGKITVTAGSTSILAEGRDQRSFISTNTLGSGSSGDVEIQGKALLVDANNQRFGASIQTRSVGEGSAGKIRLAIDGRLEFRRGGNLIAQGKGSAFADANIEIDANEILIDGNNNSRAGGTFTGISLDVDGDTASTGALIIRARNIELRDGGVISSISTGASETGDITITADRLSLVGGQDSASLSNINTGTIPGTNGNGGSIKIVSGEILLSGNASIFSNSLGGGDAGAIDISAESRLQLLDQSSISASTGADSSGQAGSIAINTSDLVVVGESVIDSLVSGSGDAGSIAISADTALLDGEDGSGFRGITTQAGPGSSGNAGDIRLDIENLTILDSAEISSSSFGSGSAGRVSITSDRIVIDSSRANARILTGISTAVDFGSAGDAGVIDITANQLVLRGDNSEISSINDGTGAAGTINLQLNDGLIIDEGADILTISEVGGGGGITINAGDYIAVTGPDAIISSTVADDTGNAGDILIEAPILALGDAGVLARADGGQGGDIQISVDDLTLSPDAEINAEAGATGVDGTVAVSSPEVDLSSGLVALDGRFIDVSALLRERCAARREETSSSFTLGTGGAVPTDLDAPRLSLLQIPIKPASADHRPGQRTVLVLPCPKANAAL